MDLRARVTTAFWPVIFPEIEYDKIDKIRGMDIIIVTTAKTDEEGRALLQQVGAPFAR